ncbi:competence protein ComK [Bacillus sp. V5-8f]|uniref:competence protein ComK n=1 Tax=Bacillus sp. V5-8f TaxID=2053044 RepID=UPI0015E0DB27|nr:competence protein ComK [Bacillus sp. V5-8f]
MKPRSSYLINEKTVLLATEFDKHGHECTRIIHGDHEFLVGKRLKEIMDATLKCFGSSLAISVLSSKGILGRKYMVPIVINPGSSIVLIPFKRAGRKEMIWLALSHIIEAEKISKETTKIYMNYGHSLTMNMKIKHFETRRQIGAFLQIKVIENAAKSATFLYEPESGFKIMESKAEYNLIIKKGNQE